jgi:hypothetical protein
MRLQHLRQSLRRRRLHVLQGTKPLVRLVRQRRPDYPGRLSHLRVIHAHFDELHCPPESAVNGLLEIFYQTSR